MFNNRYKPRKVGDKTIIVDNRLKGFWIVILILYAILFVINVLAWGEDVLDSFIINILFGALLMAFIWAIERKYIIAPEYIAVKYGLIGRRVRYESIGGYTFNTYNHINIYTNKGKEIKIDLFHLDNSAKQIFLETLKDNNIHEESNQALANAKFKVQFALVYTGSLLFIGIDIFLTCLFIKYTIEYWHSSEALIMIGCILITTPICIYLACCQSHTVRVADGYLKASILGIKYKTISLKEISRAYVEMVRRRTKNGSYYTEELTLHSGDKEVKLFDKIHQGYKNYDRLLSYLKANDIPFSVN